MIRCFACCIVGILAIAAIIYFAGFFSISDDNYFYLNINSKKILFETDEKFLSVALDMSFMRCFFHKFSDSDWKKFEELSSLLSPAYIRVGGTDADRTFFDLNATTDEQFLKNVSCDDYSPKGELVISGKDWIKLNKFAKKSRLNLIIDLNVLLRTNSEWDSSNAEALIKFSQENYIPLDFQLGNEPNSFRHVFNMTITGRQLANDFYKLKKLLNSSEMYKNSKLIGPDVTNPKKLEYPSLEFLSEFLSKDVVDVASWHHYYLNGRSAVLDDFISLKTFDLLPPRVESVLKVVREHSKNLPVWISETSSAYGGGAPKLSNRFVASFLWLDKLGVAARSNISVVVRQSLFKDNYALIRENFIPTPDFWISVLYRQLVGTKVINVEVAGEHKTNYLRFYAHCLASNSSLSGNIVIYGMNLSNQTERFVTSGISIAYPIHSFVFKPEFSNLKAKSVLLNERELTYNETVAQDMLQAVKESEFPLYIEPYSIGFWVLKELNEYACQK